MRINARLPHDWYLLNQEIQNFFQTSSRVYIYPSFHQAVYETLMGLYLRYPNKKKWVAQTGFGDHLRGIELDLARHGIRLKTELEAEVLAEPLSVLTYVHDLDDALTGQLYDHLESLKNLSTTRIPRIHLAHHLIKERPNFINKLSDHDVVIAAIDEGCALVFSSERMSYPVLGVAQMNWNVSRDWPDIHKRLTKPYATFEKEILAFESQLPEGLTPWFAPDQAQRTFDRSLIRVTNHDGAAFVQLLAEELNVQLFEPGCDNLLEAASFARWQNKIWHDQSPRMGMSEEDLRGLVLIHGSLIKDGLQGAISKTLKKLESLSS